MVQIMDTRPETNERPAIYADRIGRIYAIEKSDDHKKEFGQYLTPEPVAEFMGRLFDTPANQEILRILDPGTGSGVLSCATIESIASNRQNIRRIELVAYEHDKGLHPLLMLSMTHAQQWLQDKGIELIFEIRDTDFVLDNAHHLYKQQSFDQQPEQFDYIISNPPYFKLNKADPRAQVASLVVHGQPNIYAIFMAISAYMLKPDGELVYIIPRSFTAGPYFRLFREKFFEVMQPERIHLFGSRKETFNRDEILQEHLILKARKQPHRESQKVIISTSAGIKGMTTAVQKSVPLCEVIDMKTGNKYFYIPTCDADEKVISLVNSWSGSLHKYGMEISTGPVVPFRAIEFITDEQATPLLWMQNVKAMEVSHPVPTRKQQYILSNDQSAYLLLPNKNYVLLRRFSAKEEDRRLVAAPYMAASFQPHDLVGFENHVNYIYRPKGELTEAETFGISAILNCRILDNYFRTYNGNTQVSATELRSTPLPPLDVIRQIGEHVKKHRMSNGILNEYCNEILTGELHGEVARGTGNTKRTRATTGTI